MKFQDSRRHSSAKHIPENHPKASKAGGSKTNKVFHQVASSELTHRDLPPEGGTLRLDDFVFMSDQETCWLGRAADICLLEACGSRTRVLMLQGTVLVRRSLAQCERRLDPSSFFRANRNCIVNLIHVKQTRFLDGSRVLLLLPTNKQIIVSGKENAAFRKMRAL
ncbi:MAG TPA: LytTR family DNA-binding domain-containing protein [Terrimicrobiaceae bacterium]